MKSDLLRIGAAGPFGSAAFYGEFVITTLQKVDFGI